MIKITNDLFDVAERIKNINPDYELYFDKNLQKFTVWANGKRQVILPYDRLDKRSIDYLYQTHVKNIDALLDRLDKENEKATRQKEKDLIENLDATALRSIGN